VPVHALFVASQQIRGRTRFRDPRAVTTVFSRLPPQLVEGVPDIRVDSELALHTSLYREAIRRARVSGKAGEVRERGGSDFFGSYSA
jgi:hypothetical protein